MVTTLRFSSIQKGLLLFWAAWLSLVALTNVLGGLKALGALPQGWTLASYNHGMVVATVGAHGVPAGVAAVLFAGVVAWEALAAVLFWRAFAALLRGRPGTADEVSRAFAVSLALWAAFLLATEATVTYATAPTHMGILIAQLLTLLVVRASDAPAPVAAPAAERATSAAGR